MFSFSSAAPQATLERSAISSLPPAGSRFLDLPISTQSVRFDLIFNPQNLFLPQYVSQ